MNLENIMLSKRSQVTEDHMLYDSPYKTSRLGRSIETENRLVVTRREKWRMMANGSGISFWGDEKRSKIR